VVVVAVLTVLGRTSNVIAPAGNELGALAFFASSVSLLDGFLGISAAVLFDVFTPRPLLFAARSLFRGFRSHLNLSGRGERLRERSQAILHKWPERILVRGITIMISAASGDACEHLSRKDLTMAKGNNSQGKDKKKAKAKAPAKPAPKAAAKKK
jgi:hypothetical protein